MAQSTLSDRFEDQHPVYELGHDPDYPQFLMNYYNEVTPIESVSLERLNDQFRQNVDAGSPFFEIVGVKQPMAPIYQFVLRWFSQNNLTVRPLRMGRSHDKLRVLNLAWYLTQRIAVTTALHHSIEEDMMPPRTAPVRLSSFNDSVLARHLIDPLTHLLSEELLLSEQLSLCEEIVGMSGLMEVPAIRRALQMKTSAMLARLTKRQANTTTLMSPLKVAATDEFYFGPTYH